MTARAEGHLFSLGVSLEGALTRPVDEWRSLEWSGRQVFEVEAFDLRDADGTLSMVREGGETRIALEVTEAGTQRSQRATTELERSPPGTVLEGEDTLVPPGGKLTGPRWVGDEAEREWSSIVLDHIRRKTATLSRFRSADEYQLLVYDNTHLIGLDLHQAGGFLAADLAEWEVRTDSQERAFSVISVLQDAQLLHDLRGDRAVLPVGC